MIETSPTTSAGVAALLHLVWDTASPGRMPGTEGYLEALEEDEALGILATVWRALTGLDGNPDDFEGLPEFYAHELLPLNTP